MAFLEKLGKKIGNAAEVASDKAKDFAEITKLNNSISAEKKEIDSMLYEIGKWAFEQHRDFPESPIAVQCSRISASKKNIELFKEKIEEIKLGPDLSEEASGEAVGSQSLICSNCGKSIPENSKFCPECGKAKID